MSYHVVDPADLDPTAEYPCDRRPVATAAGLSTVAAAVYELAPGEELARQYHFHEQREELFYVVAGTLYVETPDGEYEVSPETIFVVEPDSPIRPFNPESAGNPVKVFGVGAPQHDIGRAYVPEDENHSTGEKRNKS